MKCIHGVWYYMGREYDSLHKAMLAAREVLLTVLAVREVLTLAHAC